MEDLQCQALSKCMNAVRGARKELVQYSKVGAQLILKLPGTWLSSVFHGCSELVPRHKNLQAYRIRNTQQQIRW